VGGKWNSHEKAVKHYYSIGFTEKELQEIDAASEKLNHGSSVLAAYYRKRTHLIKYMALSYIDLEKENRQLKSVIRNAQAQSAAMGQGGESDETAWTGYFRGVKSNGNVLYPEWG